MSEQEEETLKKNKKEKKEKKNPFCLKWSNHTVQGTSLYEIEAAISSKTSSIFLSLNTQSAVYSILGKIIMGNILNNFIIQRIQLPVDSK